MVQGGENGKKNWQKADTGVYKLGNSWYLYRIDTTGRINYCLLWRIVVVNLTFHQKPFLKGVRKGMREIRNDDYLHI